MEDRSTIEFHFLKALGQADALLQISSDIQRLVAEPFGDSMQACRTGFTGEASGQYMEKGKRLEERLADSALRLRIAAQNMRKTAKELYEAEMENIRTVANG